MEHVSAPARLEWRRDVMSGFEQASLAPVTLVRSAHQPDQPRAVVVHIHGYNDYFFQQHVADAFLGLGLAFYAVDMRRAGRSLAEGETPHHIGDISELVEDIGTGVAAAMADAGDLPLIVHSHSTGALAATVWADTQPDPHLAGLILNGPFYGLKLVAWEKVAMAVLPPLAKVRPEQVVVPAPSHYTEKLVEAGWEFDQNLKRPGGQPATAGWLYATRRAQKQVARGLNIEVPILIARSDSSGRDRTDNPLHQQQDVVVDTDVTAAYAPGLGPDVEDVVIDRALHDVALSPEPQRQQFFDACATFLDRVLK